MPEISCVFFQRTKLIVLVTHGRKEDMTWKEKRRSSVSEALRLIESNMRVFLHGACATPLHLIDGLISEAPRLKNVELVHIHTGGAAAYADAKFASSFRVCNLFVGANMRKKMAPGRVDYLPVFLSEIPTLFRSGRFPIDAALIQVSPPDRHGFCTLGTSVDIARAAVENARHVIAQVNHRMPRIHGDGFIHMDQISAFVEFDEALPEHLPVTLAEEEKRIGKFVAEVVDDGATIQTGIGSIPDAVVDALKTHKNLGVHTELWSDGVLDLIERGVVNNSMKKVHRGKSVSTFLMGSQKLYDFVHDNPSVIQLEANYVNDTRVISRNPKVVAINSAVEIDLTGQVCADSIGSRIISGVGGQMDFIRGASLSEGGKPIIALQSRTASGLPRLVPQLKPGAGVVTTRAHVHYVVTEWGRADLYGKTLSERAKLLIGLAHPDDREKLERGWAALFS